MSDRRPATTIGELDVHIGYLAQQMMDIQAAIADMATRADLEKLAGRIESLATRDELRALEDRLSRETVPGFFGRVGSGAGKVAAIWVLLASIGGASFALVRWIDSATPRAHSHSAPPDQAASSSTR